MNVLKPSATLATLIVAGSLAGCYVLPIGPDGQPVYPAYPHHPAPGQYPHPTAGVPGMPMVLQARLYPMNDAAAQTGILSGSITAMPGGKGHFQLNYRGEILTGEATRVSNDERRGVASAFGQGGLSMSCEYQMKDQRQGAGSCNFSNGARYQVHIGA
jgi:hypothetical protein